MNDVKELRAVYAETLCSLADKDKRIVVLEADLMKATGTGIFKERFPNRFVDVGVAEQNMIGVAAGLSAYGKIPFANTFAPFATRRVFDHITVSVAYAGLNVKICGTDPGVTAELNGGTHMSFEDVAIMRSLPNMTIFEPVDAVQLEKALPQIAEYYGPVYIRLYRRNAFTVYKDDYNFKLGKADVLQQGGDITIAATGCMVEQAIYAADLLQKEGVSVRLINVHTIKPLDKDAILQAAKETGAILTAENHSVIGGLGSAVAEVLSEEYPVPLKRIGVMDQFGEVGRKDDLMRKFGLTAQDIVKGAKDLLKLKAVRKA